MKTILLVRHAIAEARGPAWPDDTVRPLTKKGELRMREIARRLKALGEASDVVVTSPLKRAKDTALILMREWSSSSDVEEIDALAPGHTPAQTMAAVAEEITGDRIALVGHEPDLGQFAAWLLSAKQPLLFKKGGVARVDLESLSRPREGQLIWLATPRLLRTRK
jgi:phosphohistidine phosphatase